MIAGVLHTKIEAVCPISSVSLGRIDDKKTWVVSFDNKATEKQKADAQMVIDGFDVEAEQDIINKMSEYRSKAFLNASKELAVLDGRLDIVSEIQKEIDA